MVKFVDLYNACKIGDESRVSELLQARAIKQKTSIRLVKLYSIHSIQILILNSIIGGFFLFLATQISISAHGCLKKITIFFV